IADEGQVIGLLVFRFLIDEFSNVLTGEMAWERDGLGKTGEVYLVGADGFMRSESRFRLEKPDDYPDILRQAKYSEKQIEAVKRLETTVCSQEARDDALERASDNQSGTEILKDYRGVPVLAANAPLRNEQGYRWFIVAKQDVDEAFAPISAFGRLVGIT